MSDLSCAKLDRRLGAYVIDAIICFPLALVFVFVVVRPIMFAFLVPVFPPERPVDPRAAWAALDASHKAVVFLLFFASMWVPSGLYYALLESSSRRATLGKMALGLATVRVDGARVSFLRATARYYVKAVVLVVPFGFVVILQLFGNRQGLHDWVTGVLVVHRRKNEAAGTAPSVS